MVNELMKKLKAKSKVDVIRQGLQLLKQTTDRAALAEEFRLASILNREDIEELLGELEGVDDHLIPPYDDDDTPPKSGSRK